MKANLCDDFAMKILDREIELECRCNIQNLNQVVELYREAIEYYEEIKSPKFWDFQERLQKILMRPAVLKMMQEENSKYKTTAVRSRARGKTHVPTMNHNHLNRANSERTEEVSLEVITEAPEHTKNVSRIVENQHKRTEHVSTKAMTDIKSQELSLTERLNNRRQKALNISTESCFVSFAHYKDLSLSVPPSPAGHHKKNSFYNIESDKSAGLNSFSQLHVKIEKILEESFYEKSEKITEIKVKYGTQIQEMESEGGIYVEIVKQMKGQMKQEIDEISRILDEKRKNRIIEAKNEFIN